MLKFRSDEFAGRLCGSVSPESSLRVALKFVQGGGYGSSVRFPHPLIAANKRGE
jgi:hypothetical protein